MKITMLCAAILSVAALASAETTINQYPTDIEMAAPQSDPLPPKATPITDFNSLSDDPATKRASLTMMIQQLQAERNSMLSPAPGENYDQAQLRQEQAELTQKRIDKLLRELMTIQ